LLTRSTELPARVAGDEHFSSASTDLSSAFLTFDVIDDLLANNDVKMFDKIEQRHRDTIFINRQTK
jgi:hypothetical protein